MLENTPIRLNSSASTSSNPFFRDAKICPDGSCILVSGEDRSLSLFDLPPIAGSPWTPIWTYRPPDALLSFEWFPGATKASPPMFAFVVGVKDHPIQLLDGSDHSIRASYPIIDHRERFIAPHAMAFTLDGCQLYCGFENAIEIINVGTPGSSGTRFRTLATRSSQYGQKGIISTLAFSPDGSGLLAAGSFSGTIGFYNTVTSAEPYLVDLVHCADTGTGVTKLVFHPASHLLYSASRLSNAIEIWDMRNLTMSKGLWTRSGSTNQRLGLDVDPTGAFVAVGDDAGCVSIFNAEFEPEFAEPISSFQAAPPNQSIGAVVFETNANRLITCSGARKFQKNRSSGTRSDSDEEEAEVTGEESDHSLKLWQLV